MPVIALLAKIALYIVNPIIVLGFVISTIILFYGIIKMILSADSSDLPEKRRSVIYGVLGMFIMFSVYGILRLVLASFDIPWPGFFP